MTRTTLKIRTPTEFGAITQFQSLVIVLYRLSIKLSQEAIPRNFMIIDMGKQSAVLPNHHCFLRCFPVCCCLLWLALLIEYLGYTPFDSSGLALIAPLRFVDLTNGQTPSQIRQCLLVSLLLVQKPSFPFCQTKHALMIQHRHDQLMCWFSWLYEFICLLERGIYDFQVTLFHGNLAEIVECPDHQVSSGCNRWEFLLSLHGSDCLYHRLDFASELNLQRPALTHRVGPCKI